MAKSMPNVELAVTHLNVPVGAVLSSVILAEALRQGSTRRLDCNDLSRALIATLFCETSLSLILRCISESDSTVESADCLYRESLLDRMHPVEEWEALVRGE